MIEKLTSDDTVDVVKAERRMLDEEHDEWKEMVALPTDEPNMRSESS